MNNKITFPDLVDAVAEAANTSKRVSEIFLKELFAVISETLEKGESVKVKNLGTFKTVDVDSRKSVNVNTGAEIEIPAHRKVSFTPDKTLAEALNMPFESFETIVLSDDLSEDELKQLTSTDNEDLGLTADEPAGEMAENESTEVEESEDVPEDDMRAVLDDAETSDASDDETKNAAEVQPPVFTDKEEKKPTVEDAVVPPPFRYESTPPPFRGEGSEHDKDANQKEEDMGIFNKLENEESEEQKAERLKREAEIQAQEDADAEEIAKKYAEERFEERLNRNRSVSFTRGFLWGVVAAVLVCGVAGYCIYAHFDERISSIEAEKTLIASSRESEPTKTESPAVAVVDTPVVAIDAPEVPKKEAVAANEPLKSQSAVKRDTVRPNNYLTQMSVKYYGKSLYWVYIYEENKAKLPNPNSIKPGTEVVIPPAEKYGIDRKNPESVKKAQQKAYDILKEHE